MHVAVLDLKLEAAETIARQITAAGHRAVPVGCNVLQRQSVELAHIRCEQLLGHVDILINGAGGNHPMATTGPDKPFFDIPVDAFEKVMDLNILGTVIPSMVFGKPMAKRGEGIILNIASMRSAANRALALVR